ncbi:tetratricopeptide repeat protein [Nonlabens xiamenensis]|uniref:tetratricopeptide repeat protein n=1 Tax=Nonlabens xiamenensis TaxID=2341043 RepID=UPI000F609F38|nr:tetratricopeptide repeat protein [Nonlabens xiamenensis]
MKIKMTLLFLAFAGLAFAQKKEMRKIERAIQKQDYSQAQSIFKEIDPASVEEDYLADYNFYKAATLIDLTGKNKASLEDLRTAEESMKIAIDKGYENKEYLSYVDTAINARKFELANEALAAQDRETALILVEEMYEKNPDNLQMLYNAANIAYGAEKFDNALNKYQTLLDKNYTGVNTIYTAVNSKGEVDQFSSKKVRDISVKTGSHNSPAEEKTPSNLGDIVLKTVWLYKNDQQMDKAKEVFETAVQEYPSDQSLQLAKADIYLTLEMMDEYKKASEELSKTVKDPSVYDNLALAALKKKDYDQAINYYSESLALESDNYPALVNVSNAYLEKGNLDSTTYEEQQELYKEAIKHLEKAHLMKPEEKGIIQTLISLYGVFEMEDKIAEMKAKL